METFSKTSELWSLVFEHLATKKFYSTGRNLEEKSYDEDDYVKARRTLVACSRVNRLVSREALRILWRSVTTSKTFIGLLPPEAVKIFTQGVFKLQHVKITRPLTPSDFEKILQYIPLVRSFNAIMGAVTLKPYACFSDYFPNKALFPNLITLEWSGPLDDDIFALCLGPGLRDVTINPDFHTPQAEDVLLKMIGRLAKLPNLRSLSILGCQFTAARLQLYKVFQSSLALKSLDLPHISISNEDLLLLQSLPGLEDLWLDIDSLVLDSIQLAKPVSGGFSRLRALTLTGTVRNSIDFLQHSVALPQRELTFYTTCGSPSRLSFIDLFGCIGTALPRTLTKIILKPREFWHQSGGAQGPQEAISMTDMSALARFTELKVLVLQLPYTMSLCNGDVPSFCGMFPKVEHLALCCDPKVGGYKPRLTPRCLALFANAAPQLQSLSLYMKSRWIPYAKSNWSLRSTSNLISLDVGFSKLECGAWRTYQESDVLMTLGDLFPRLEFIHWGDPYRPKKGYYGLSREGVTIEELKYRDTGLAWDRIYCGLKGLRAFQHRTVEATKADLLEKIAICVGREGVHA